MHIIAVTATDLFVGTPEDPRQVVRVVVGNSGDEPTQNAQVVVRGAELRTPEAVELRSLAPGAYETVEVGVELLGEASPGDRFPAEVHAYHEGFTTAEQFEFVVAEPGWRMFMVSHFHYDPVWWNTQAAYTEEFEAASAPFGLPFQLPGFELVHAHLDAARRDPTYRFVLAELDYLKPYWATYPGDREWIRELLAAGRLELVGGTYNEANTNLVSAENTARNAIYGIGYQRDVLGGRPATAWQLDVFGHDPQFPGLMAAAGLTSSSFARGPFHEWGPNWFLGVKPELRAKHSVGGLPLMQFATEFEWVSPSGAGLLTSYMANHYSAGWWMDASATLDEARAETYRLFREMQAVAATRNVLLPVGTDYTPPNKWVSEIARDWNERYVWPRFECATPADFFAAVRHELESEERWLLPQTRDLNPIYTGKDVSYIDTKQMHRDAENTLLFAERFATFAALLGGRFPSEAVDKAWRQLVFNAHHDGITGAESDQVYLDLLGGWREAFELARDVRDRSLDLLAEHVNTRGDGQAVVVFNPMSWPRTDVVTADVVVDAPGVAGIELRDGEEPVPACSEWEERRADGSLSRVRLAFVAHDVPATGYRTYRAVPAGAPTDDPGWGLAAGTQIENDHYLIEVDPERGGAIVRVYDKDTGREILPPDGTANELRAYGEYPQHPRFGEGPWHLTPDGSVTSSQEAQAEVRLERCAIGQRITVTGPFAGCTRTQEVILWDGVDRVEMRTHLDGWEGQDTLFRVRFSTDVPGGMPVSEVANAVIGRGFAFPDADVAETPFTLDNPCNNWFGIGSTARVALSGGASRAISIAEVVIAEGSVDRVPVRGLVTALVRQGVTSTVSEDTGPRYGRIDLDSNLPDVRIALGGPEENAFTAAVLAAADPAYTGELERQLQSGQARVWVPAERPLLEAWVPNANLCGVRDLPVLIVAGGTGAVDALSDDLADAVIDVDQPGELDGETGQVDDFGVAVLNRGMPGFAVDTSGRLHLSLMRACSGWPSGVWIDPPRRTLPGGGNFQFQHWSHTFEYALVGHEGDWRRGGLVRRGHDYNNPLVARIATPHDGPLPPAAALLEVEGDGMVVTTVKPAGNPMARMAAARPDPRAGIVVRLYETAGQPTTAALRCHWPLRNGFRANLLEEERDPLPTAGGAVRFDLDGCGIATIGALPEIAERSDGDLTQLGPQHEPAQPVFSDYWLHNRGAAPLGYQPVTVQIVPAALVVDEPFDLPITVASEHTDDAVAGMLTLDVPPGWSADPPEHLYRLSPGAYLAIEPRITPSPDAEPGRYFVAARITDPAGQVHEDVVAVDLHPDGDSGDGPLTLRVDRATRKATIGERGGGPATGPDGDLTVTLSNSEVVTEPGVGVSLVVRLENLAASDIRGEAQLLSPYETWRFTHPWSQGFAVSPGEVDEISFHIDPAFWERPGAFWALVKITHFGRRLYSETVRVDVADGGAGARLAQELHADHG